MSEQATGKAKQENQQHNPEAQKPAGNLRNQESSNRNSQALQSRQGRNPELHERERRSGGSNLYPSIFSVSPGEFFTMSPITLMRRFTEDIDRAFGIGENRVSNESQEQELGWIPRIEVRQSGDNLVVHAELPGVQEQDVRVEATDEGLLLEGERKREHEVNEGGWHRSEFSYGRFSRLIPLPESAKIDNARANFQNGVLEITIPIPQTENKRRQIPIGTSATGGSQQKTGAGKEEAGRAASAGR